MCRYTDTSTDTDLFCNTDSDTDTDVEYGLIIGLITDTELKILVPPLPVVKVCFQLLRKNYLLAAVLIRQPASAADNLQTQPPPKR
jgi:hypothetical protein